MGAAVAPVCKEATLRVPVCGNVALAGKVRWLYRLLQFVEAATLVGVTGVAGA